MPWGQLTHVSIDRPPRPEHFIFRVKKCNSTCGLLGFSHGQVELFKKVGFWRAAASAALSHTDTHDSCLKNQLNVWFWWSKRGDSELLSGTWRLAEDELQNCGMCFCWNAVVSNTFGQSMLRQWFPHSRYGYRVSNPLRAVFLCAACGLFAEWQHGWKT